MAKQGQLDWCPFEVAAEVVESVTTVGRIVAEVAVAVIAAEDPLGSQVQFAAAAAMR